jgi:tRNA A-37 threonylcarbamoyl transferase component Bud32
MATVFLGALQGDLGFRQLVAIKRPHPHLLDDRGFRDAWMREARLAAGIHHANVVDVRDVEAVGDGLQLVMDYIEGASLGELVSAATRDSARIPAGVAVRVVLDACSGLHAAHEARDDAGKPLGLVHRDVSPQNILVGVDGVARVTDFGIAKCAQAAEQATTQGMLKGKAGYMAPEYVRGESIDRRADVFALGVVLWEALSGKRLFRGENDGETLGRVLETQVPPASKSDARLAPLDDILARALARDRADRFATTEDLALALEPAASAHGLVATHADVGRFVRSVVGDRLEERRRAAREVPAVTVTAVTAVTAAAEESTTVSQPQPRARTRLWVGVAGGIVLVGAGALAIGRSRGTPAATTPPAAAATSAATPASSAIAPGIVTADPPAIIPSSSAVASAAPSPRTRPPPRPPTRASGHAPPPNPYPTGP